MWRSEAMVLWDGCDLWVCDLCGICFIIHMCVRCCLLFSVQPVLLLYVCELPVVLVQPWRLMLYVCKLLPVMFVVLLYCYVCVLLWCLWLWNVAWLWLWNVPCYVHAKGGKMLSKFTFEWAVSLFFSNFRFLSGIPETEPNFPKPKPNFPNPK
jgi:hypothetical protein